MSSSADEHAKPSRTKATLALFVCRITPTCREVARLSSEERDHPLPIMTQLRLSLHRRFCVWCDRYAQQLGLLHEAMHQSPEHLESLTISAERKAQLKRTLQGEAAARRLR